MCPADMVEVADLTFKLPHRPTAAAMEPIRSYDDSTADFERRAIKELEQLSTPVVESFVYGVMLHWDTSSVADFVKVANLDHVTTDLPSWVTQPRGQITVDGFKSDVMAVLSEVSGGLAGENLAPNTFTQNHSVLNRLAHIEMEPFVQACMIKLEPTALLAAAFILFECPGLSMSPAHLLGPPPPSRQVFY